MNCCPQCKHLDIFVNDSRPTKHELVGMSVRRRRTCKNCDHRWTTYEISSEILDRLSQQMVGFSFEHLITILEATAQTLRKTMEPKI